MRPLSRRVLAVTALVVAVAVLGLARVTDGVHRPLPRLGPASLLVLAGLVLLLASSVRARLTGAPGTRPIVPTGVAKALAVGRSGAIVGAVLAGGWAGLAVDRLLDVATLNSARVDLAVALGGTIAAVLLLAAGLRLEDSCRAR